MNISKIVRNFVAISSLSFCYSLSAIELSDIPFPGSDHNDLAAPRIDVATGVLLPGTVDDGVHQAIVTPIVSAINQNSNHVRRSTALGAALSSLPTDSGGDIANCGIGGGFRGGYTAMAMGCATDLGNLLPVNAPSFFRNAGVNFGGSFLAHDDPDPALKVGLVFKFRENKSNSRVSFKEQHLRRSLRVANLEKAAVLNENQEIQSLKQENKRLQSQINQINKRLELLSMTVASK